VWKVLRDTDGERFVVENKRCAFSGEFVRCKKRNPLEKFSSAIEIFLDAIIYPRPVELFAFQKDRCATANRIFFAQCAYGPPEIELGVAKKIPITIMRLPRWKRLIAQSEALKSDLIFESCLQVSSTYKFCNGPPPNLPCVS
jgi:hypothetical protein